MMCFCDWLLVTNYLKNSLLCVYTTLFHPLSYELSLEPFLGYLNYISVLSSLTKIKILFFFKKKKKKKGQVQELDWTQVKMQPMSKERLWETFRNPGEWFIKTPLEAKFKEMIHGCAFSLTQQLRHSALTASDGKRSCKSTLLECTIGDVCACARVHVYMLIISCPNGRWCNGVSPPTSYSSHLLSTFFIQHAQLCGHLDEMAHVPVKPVAVATLVLLFSFCLKACASSFFFHPSWLSAPPLCQTDASVEHSAPALCSVCYCG